MFHYLLQAPSCSLKPVFTPVPSPLIGLQANFSVDMVTAAAPAGSPAVSAFSWRAPLQCFVCIIKEAKYKPMKRYGPKLLKRKWGTMRHLRSVLASMPPQWWSCISVVLDLLLELPEAEVVGFSLWSTIEMASRRSCILLILKGFWDVNIFTNMSWKSLKSSKNMLKEIWW